MHLFLGYGSANNMLFFMRNRTEWKDTKERIGKFVNQCKICSAAKEQKKLKNITGDVKGPNNTWKCDLNGPLYNKEGNKRYICMVQDQYTKIVVAGICKSKTSKEIVDLIHKLIIRKYGIPKKNHNRQWVRI